MFNLRFAFNCYILFCSMCLDNCVLRSTVFIRFKTVYFVAQFYILDGYYKRSYVGTMYVLVQQSGNTRYTSNKLFSQTFRV